MRLLALVVALSLLLAACIGNDDDPTPEAPEATPTVETATQPPDDPDPTATESEPDPTATAEPAPTDEPEPTAEPADPTPTEPAAEPTADIDDDDLEAIIQQIAEQTAEIRGLPLLEEIDIEFFNRDELRESLIAMLEDEYGQEQADLDRDLLWMLRLIPDRSLDYYQLQIDLLTEQVAGYYDSDTGELVVVSDGGPLTADQKVTMSHEIVHALQDQHFGLDRFEDEEGTLERSAAFSALVEGDATWAMIQWAITHLTMEEISEFLAAGDDVDTTTLDSAPRYVQEALVFPYNAGFPFVEALVADGGIEAVDAAFDHPPASTYQILNPETYLTEPREEPEEVLIEDLSLTLVNEWENVYEDTLGVFDLIILLEENGVANGAAATAEWAGTNFEMWQSGDNLVTVLATSWQSDEAVETFQNALVQTMTDYEQQGEYWFDGNRHHAIFTDGPRVVLSSATTRDDLTAALGAQQLHSP